MFWGGGGGASTLPFIGYPSRVTSSELEAGEAGDSPFFGSEVAILPPGLRKRILFIKSRGEVDGGRRRFSRLRATHFLLPSNLWDGAVDSDGAIRLDDALCFLDESSWKRCRDKINVLQTFLKANHLVTKMQRRKAT